jgi:four helix bundle protein
MQKHKQKYKSDLKGRCYQLSIDLIGLIDNFPNKRSCWVIGDQLLRSGTSIGANLTEAQGSSSKRDFKRFHEIALKSANETMYWLGLLKDARKVEAGTVDPILNEVNEIAKMIASGILRMKGKL